MDQKIQEFIAILENVDKENIRLKEIAGDYQSTAVNLSLHGKFNGLDKDSDCYIRCEAIYEMKKRTVLFFEALKEGISEIFLPESIIFENEVYGISCQKKVPLWGKEYLPEHVPPKILFDNQYELSCRLFYDYPDLYDKIYDFFELYKIRGISGENAGVDENNKIKIFDWFGGYVVGSDGKIYIRAS